MINIFHVQYFCHSSCDRNVNKFTSFLAITNAPIHLDPPEDSDRLICNSDTASYIVWYKQIVEVHVWAR